MIAKQKNKGAFYPLPKIFFDKKLITSAGGT